jgi:hypothetical protein
VLNHLVILTLSASATAEDRAAIADGLGALPEQIPGLTSIEVHQDLGLADDAADLAFSMAFEDEESWRGYSTHPAHVDLVTRLIKPVVTAKVALQYR